MLFLLESICKSGGPRDRLGSHVSGRVPYSQEPARLCIPKVHAKAEPPRTSGARLRLTLLTVGTVLVANLPRHLLSAASLASFPALPVPRDFFDAKILPEFFVHTFYNHVTVLTAKSHDLPRVVAPAFARHFCRITKNDATYALSLALSLIPTTTTLLRLLAKMGIALLCWHYFRYLCNLLVERNEFFVLRNVNFFLLCIQVAPRVHSVQDAPLSQKTLRIQQ